MGQTTATSSQPQQKIMGLTPMELAMILDSQSNTNTWGNDNSNSFNSYNGYNGYNNMQLQNLNFFKKATHAVSHGMDTVGN